MYHDNSRIVFAKVIKVLCVYPMYSYLHLKTTKWISTIVRIGILQEGITNIQVYLSHFTFIIFSQVYLVYLVFCKILITNKQSASARGHCFPWKRCIFPRNTNNTEHAVSVRDEQELMAMRKFFFEIVPLDEIFVQVYF